MLLSFTLVSRQQAVGSSDNSDSSMPVKKKARKKKAPGMDEDTMMALALSRSLLEQEKERDRDREEERRIQAQLESTKSGAAPVVVQGRSGAGELCIKLLCTAIYGHTACLDLF